MPTLRSTHWSLVLAAGRRASPESERALAELCQTYWPPVHDYIRRQTNDLHLAQDLTQEFFARLLEKNALAAADPQRGCFRAFLWTSVMNFLANARDRAQAQKRGGGRKILTLDFAAHDSYWNIEPSHELTPEKLFDRRWALLVLEAVFARLREEYAGKNELFERLKDFLTGELSASLAEIGAKLDMSEGAIKTAAHRLRKRFRALLRAEVAQTLADDEPIDEEIRALFDALAS